MDVNMYCFFSKGIRGKEEELALIRLIRSPMIKQI